MAENSSFENLGPRWYVVHTYTGYENKVKANLEKIVENRNMGHMIFECTIPVERKTARKEKWKSSSTPAMFS